MLIKYKNKRKHDKYYKEILNYFIYLFITINGSLQNTKTQ